MVAKFNIFSYRDAIYDLSEMWDINSKDIVIRGIKHRIWWLDMFSEDFVLAREEKC